MSNDEYYVNRCLDGHPDDFRHLVRRYQNVLMAHLVGQLGNSVLHSCVASPEATRLVLAKGARTVINKDNGCNPIHVYASAYPHHKRDAVTLDLLIAAGGDINGVDNQGNSPLHLATLQGRIDMVEQLLKRQAVIDIANKKGETPLAWVREKGNTEMISLLLAHGATR